MAVTLNSLAQTFLPPSAYQWLAASDIRKRLARGSFWALVNALVVKMAALVQAILLARILGISGFGEWAILLSTGATIGLFTSYGLGTTTTKFVAEWRESELLRLGRLLGLLLFSALILGLVACVVLILAAVPLAEHLLAAPKLSGAVSMIGIIVLLQAMSGVYGGVLYGLEKFRESAIIQSISGVVGVALTLTLALKIGLNGAILGLLFTSLLTAGALAWRATGLMSRIGIHPPSNYQGLFAAIPT